MKKAKQEAPQQIDAARVALNRKQFLQRAGIAGAGAMLGGVMSRADAAPNDTREYSRAVGENAAPRLAQGNAAPKQANAGTRGAMILGETNVRDYGAKGDGATDDTKAFQDAINDAGERGGGTVFVPKARYMIRGHLNLPAHVTLRGVSEIPDVPSPNFGSILLATEGKGKADGTPFITMQRASSLKRKRR